ncbi:MAG: tetratricopeptide repeat protein [Gammaproteobacteria bacterium]|nr:tetratricopeptide repeat protein [Gammaproteobacteria bacterium]
MHYIKILTNKPINKTLLLGITLLYSTTAFSWMVSQRVVELSGSMPISELAHNTALQSQAQSFVVLAPTLESFKVSQNPPTAFGLKTSTDPKAFTFEKRPAQLSVAEEMNVDYKRALYHYAKGNDVKAEPLFLRVLSERLDYHPARVALATLYLQQKKLDLAQNLLLEGLLLDEYHPDFLRLVAYIHDRRQAPEKALELLTKVRNHQRQDKHYISFLGYIYQKTGHYDLARQQYFRLLEKEPYDPAWLLGLSIALESEGERESALEGYKRLSDKMGVDPNIVKYAKERMLALKG